MNEQNEVHEQKATRPSRAKMLSVMGVAIGVAVVCFTVVALLPASAEPFFDAPLRSALTGLGLLGVACPLCLAGLLLKKRSASSPYFEEAFIATVISLCGLVCLMFGLLCIGLSLYAIVTRLLGTG